MWVVLSACLSHCYSGESSSRGVGGPHSLFLGACHSQVHLQNSFPLGHGAHATLAHAKPHCSVLGLELCHYWLAGKMIEHVYAPCLEGNELKLCLTVGRDWAQDQSLSHSSCLLASTPSSTQIQDEGLLNWGGAGTHLEFKYIQYIKGPWPFICSGGYLYTTPETTIIW